MHVECEGSGKQRLKGGGGKKGGPSVWVERARQARGCFLT